MATTITEILGEAGACLSFQHDGKTYSVGKLKQKTKAQYEQWLHANAIEAAECGVRPALLRWKAAAQHAEDIRNNLNRLASDHDGMTPEESKTRLAEAERRAGEEEAMLEEARRAMKETKEDIATGQYRFGGTLWVKSARTVAGIVKLSALLLGNLPDEEVIELFASAGEKVSAAVETAMRQSLPKALLEQAEAQLTRQEAPTLEAKEAVSA